MPRHDEDEARGPVAWLRQWWRALAAELVATALLVWLGVAAALPLDGAKPPLAHPAMAFGFVVVANAVAFGPVSGAHMNPAVTLAALLHGALGAAPAAAYVLAQMAGAVVGFGALRATMPAPAASGTGCTTVADAVGAPAAAAIEAALTAVLALACCGAWAAHDPQRPDPAVPIKLGLVVAGLVYAGGAATGASINPARSFAPALLQNYWEHHWVYWVGPLSGAALGALLHRLVLRAPPAPRARARARAEDVPLAEKP